MLSSPALLGLIELPFPRIDPVALELPGGFAIRWYGIAFMLTFTVAYFIARRLARSGFIALPPDSIGDLLFALILGVVLGGRLGYVLFYDFASFAANPAQIIRIWEGGLSFHGGLLGAGAAAYWFSRTRAVPFLRVVDTVSLSTPPGILLVRLANFVNGELYGRPAGEGVPWAVRFPTDPEAVRLTGADGARGLRERELAVQQAYESGVWEQVRDQVPLRHPSQLYEGLLEGVLLGLVLFAVYRTMRARGRDLAAGTYTGIFLLGYGLLRAFVELFRQPDRQFTSADDPLGTVLGPLTMGQTLSLGLVLLGIVLLVRGLRRGTVPAGAPVAAEPARGG